MELTPSVAGLTFHQVFLDRREVSWLVGDHEGTKSLMIILNPRPVSNGWFVNSGPRAGLFSQPRPLSTRVGRWGLWIR
jgi:hypothetical protein